MYISGVPGTGKTATVYEAIKALSAVRNKKRLNFKFIEVNGLRLTDPYQAYQTIYRVCILFLNLCEDMLIELNYDQELKGKKASSTTAAGWLEDYFSNNRSNEEFILLLVDELDLLCTKKQTVLYHMFDWPNRPNSNLGVVAIANAMDLPERVMMSRISSRLGLTRLSFQPYTHQELQAIISSRLKGFNAFEPDAIQLVARKVAAVSGDARRALDICRRAALISESRHQGVVMKSNSKEALVKLKDVQDALLELFSSPKIVAVRNASEQEQTFLKCVLQEFRSSGVEEATFSNVYRHHRDVCLFNRIMCPSSTQLFEVAFSLYENRLILLDSNSCYLRKKIRLNISADDIDFALMKSHDPSE